MGFYHPDARYVTKRQYDAFIEKHEKHMHRAAKAVEIDGYIVYIDVRRGGALIAMEATDGHAYAIVANTDDLDEVEKQEGDK